MAGGPQKPDHRGNFYMMPRMLQTSPAWRHLSMHARVVLLVFFDRHNGFNNGNIALGVREISTSIGNQNHGATSRSIVELINHGFLECTSDANHHQAKTRTYRLTWISTGEGKRVVPATHEYLEWRPDGVQKRKFGGARTATRDPVSVTVTATERKFPVAVTATTATESRGFEADARVAVTATLLVNQSVDCPGSPSGPEIVVPPSSRFPGNRTGDGIGVDLGELREWCRAAIAKLGYGGARQLAAGAKVPEPVLSRFRAGKSLPDHHRIALQTACGRVLPHCEWRAAA